MVRQTSALVYKARSGFKRSSKQSSRQSLMLPARSFSCAAFNRNRYSLCKLSIADNCCADLRVRKEGERRSGWSDQMDGFLNKTACDISSGMMGVQVVSHSCPRLRNFDHEFCKCECECCPKRKSDTSHCNSLSPIGGFQSLSAPANPSECTSPLLSSHALPT